MEELLEEMKAYKGTLQAKAKDLMERIVRINAGTQNKTVRSFSKTLTDAHGSTNTQISLIDYQIRDLKEELSRKEVEEDEE